MGKYAQGPLSPHLFVRKKYKALERLYTFFNERIKHVLLSDHDFTLVFKYLTDYLTKVITGSNGPPLSYNFDRTTNNIHFFSTFNKALSDQRTPLL